MDLDGWRRRKYLGGVGAGETLLRINGKILFSIKKKNNAPWTEPVGIRNLLTRVRTRVQFLGLEWRR